MKLSEVLHANLASIRKGAPYITTPVSSLFRWSSPTAIGRLVIPIIVYSLYLFAWPLGTHIGYEFCENLPSFANFNAATAVLCVVIIVGILTSGFHAYPRKVFRGNLPASGVPMNYLGSPRPITSAALYFSLHERCAGGNFGVTAVTSANPSDASGLCWLFRQIQNGQASKFFSLQVDFLSHLHIIAYRYRSTI
jgi:hypothetical protein